MINNIRKGLSIDLIKVDLKPCAIDLRSSLNFLYHFGTLGVRKAQTL